MAQHKAWLWHLRPWLGMVWGHPAQWKNISSQFWQVIACEQQYDSTHLKSLLFLAQSENALKKFLEQSLRWEVLTGLVRGLERCGRAVVVHLDQEKPVLSGTDCGLAYTKQGVASSNINIYYRKLSTWSRWLLQPVGQADSLESGSPGFGPLGIEAEKQGLQTVRLIASQKFTWNNLKFISSIQFFKDLASHICQICVRVARWRDLEICTCMIFKTVFVGFWRMELGHFQKPEISNMSWSIYS